MVSRAPSPSPSTSAPSTNSWNILFISSWMLSKRAPWMQTSYFPSWPLLHTEALETSIPSYAMIYWLQCLSDRVEGHREIDSQPVCTLSATWQLLIWQALPSSARLLSPASCYPHSIIINLKDWCGALQVSSPGSGTGLTAPKSSPAFFPCGTPHHLITSSRARGKSFRI